MRLLSNIACVAVVITGVASAQPKPPAPPANPAIAFPKTYPGKGATIPLSEFPEAGRDYMTAGSKVAVGKTQVTKLGTTYRLVESTVEEVKYPLHHLARPGVEAKALTDRAKVARARLAATELAAMVPLSLRQESPSSGPTPSRFVSWYRDNETTIYVREWDLKIDGASVVQVAEMTTTQIRGHPATLVARRSADGAAYWTLVWTVEGIDFEVGVHQPAFDAGTADRILAIANAMK